MTFMLNGIKHKGQFVDARAESGTPLHLRYTACPRDEFSYMLIEDAIERAKCGGKLFPVEAGASWAGKPRVFFMCVPLRDALESGRDAEDEKERQSWAALEAGMQSFVEGAYITSNRLKQLRDYKYEHWEFINKKPRPSLRVFGRFAMPDVFVGTHVELRKRLGGMWSQNFEMEKLVCEEHWINAGLPNEPFPVGAFTDAPDFEYEAYITENASRKIKVTS